MVQWGTGLWLQSSRTGLQQSTGFTNQDALSQRPTGYGSDDPKDTPTTDCSLGGLNNEKYYGTIRNYFIGIELS